MYVGLVNDLRSRPKVNAVDTYAKAFGWEPLSAEMSAALNAKSGYAGTVAGQVVLLGSDGSNDIFAISVRDNFEAQTILRHMSQVVTLNKAASEESMGQVSEMYRIFDSDEDLGYLALTYGTAPTVRGTGTISYLSASRARAEGLGAD
jgi:hypothetical protein